MLLEQAYLSHDYYEVMGLTPDATQVEVEEAFKNHATGLDLRHPEPSERIQAAERMLLLTQAFETLSNPIQRSHYDIQMLGRQNLPVKEKVEILFKEGIRAWRKNETDLALRYLKEVSHLYPHRPLYRVHLAIAYAEKDWFTFTENELETALRLDPDFKFAKETVAKLLFKLPDKRRHWYHDKLMRQAASMAAGFVLLGVLLASGVLQNLTGELWAKVADSAKAKPKAGTQQSAEQELPEDMRKELAEKKAVVPVMRSKLPFFDKNYRPEGRVFDYSHLEAKEKVFYPEQSMVVVTYSDGSVLTYKPTELTGWKKHPSSDVPIMITANNEMIPSPTLPLKMPGNLEAKLEDPNFPAWMFPEYGIDNAIGATDPSAPSNTTAPAHLNTAPQPATAGTQAGSQADAPPVTLDTAPATPQTAPQQPQSGGGLYNPYGGG